jgi:hypothetical protein
MRALLSEHETLRGVVFDRPNVVESARREIAAAGLDDRCDAVGGSFFDEVPPGGDVCVLAQILHDWHDEDAVRILSRVRAAMRDDAVLLVLELIVPEDDDPHPAKLVDLQMLFLLGGRERDALGVGRPSAPRRIRAHGGHRGAAGERDRGPATGLTVTSGPRPAVHERPVDRKVLEPLGLRQPVPCPQRPEPLAGRERLEDLRRGARIHEHDAVVRPQADVQHEVARRDLGDHRVVAGEQVVRIAGKPPDRGVHRASVSCGDSP